MRRLDWLLGFSLFLVLIAVAILALFFWQQSRLDSALVVAPVGPIPEVASGNTAVGETALTAFGRAQNRALNWQSDAVLLSANATWPIISNMAMLLEGRENWNFVFYSPSADRAITASVANETAVLGTPYSVSAPPQPLGTEGWRMNSEAAVQIFLTNGGNQFFQTESFVTFFMHLNTVTDNGRIEWTVAALSEQTAKSITMRIDATTGDILEIQTGVP